MTPFNPSMTACPATAMQNTCASVRKAFQCPKWVDLGDAPGACLDHVHASEAAARSTARTATQAPDSSAKPPEAKATKGRSMFGRKSAA